MGGTRVAVTGSRDEEGGGFEALRVKQSRGREEAESGIESNVNLRPFDWIFVPISCNIHHYVPLAGE